MTGLFDRLKREGFTLGIDDYLKAQSLIDTEIKELINRQEEADIDNLEDLKYLLCPVLAQNQEQQQKFYRIFDEYFKRIKQQSLEQIEPEGKRKKEGYEGQKAAAKQYLFSPKTTIGIIATCVIGGLVWLYLLLTALPPVPKASFKYIHPSGDTLHQESAWRGRQGDTVSFIYHFDLDDDTAGISDVEFIWLYGDGSIDTIREIEGMLTPQRHMYQEVRNHEVQLIVRHRTHETVKAKTQQSEILIGCRNPLEASIQWLPKDPEEDEEVQFAFPLDTTYAEEDFDFLWDFGDESTPSTSASPSHRYRSDGNKRINLTVIRKIPSVQKGSACGDTAKVRKFITISSNKPNIELTAEQYTLKTDDSALTAYSLTPLSIGLLAVGLTILVLLLALLYRVLSHRKPQLASEAKYTSNRKGPYYIPFPKQDHLIAPDKGIYDLASVMRQRQRGNIHTVNLPMSIHKTIRESGMPIVHFDTSSRPSEYLVLIEKHHPQSHLARFFGRITEILHEQDVLLETFYYDKDPRKCWNEDYPDGLNLEQMRQRYSKHRLILFSDGHHLINPSKPILFRWVVPAFEIWRETRILLTPTPVVDWDYRERLIMEEMDVLPLDIPGQLHMIEMFDEIGQPAFEDHKDRMLRLFPAAACSVRSHHLTDVRGLSDYLFEYVSSGRELENPAQLSDQFFDYLSHKNSLPAQVQEDEGLMKQLELGKHLFQWIASTAVYHSPRWEITLALGHKFSQKQSDYLLTFENLLVLARIPWLQSNDVPSRLRKDLLSMLDPETETTAREVLQKLLAEAQEGIKEGSSAARKMAIQSTTNNFFLQPDQYADEMYYLVQNGMVEDHEIEQRLEKPLDILAGQATYEYLHNRYGMLRQKEWLIGALSGLVLTALFSFVLFELFIQRSNTPPWLDQQNQEESIWVEQILDQDSAIIYHNIGVGAALNGELAQGRIEIEHAKDYRESDSVWKASHDLLYPLADSNLNRLNYQLGVEKFNSKDFTSAINEFARVPSSAEDTLYRHSLAGLGLGHYFLDDTAEYQRYIQTLVNLDETFISEKYPQLYALYQHDQDRSIEEAYAFHLRLARSYLRQKAYVDASFHIDSALFYQSGDTLALRLRKDIALLLEQNKEEPIVEYVDPDPAGVFSSNCWANENAFGRELNLFAERIEKDSIWYSQSPPEALADYSGILHRFFAHVKSICGSSLFPDPVTSRDGRSIARWFAEQNRLLVIQDAAKSRNLIRPGSVMFFGKSGQSYQNFNLEDVVAPTPNHIIAHAGIVTDVRRDEKGNIISYVLMHGQRADKIAARTHYHTLIPPRKGFPALGNWNQQWVAMAYLETPGDSSESQIPTEEIVIVGNDSSSIVNQSSFPIQQTGVLKDPSSDAQYTYHWAGGSLAANPREIIPAGYDDAGGTPGWISYAITHQLSIAKNEGSDFFIYAQASTAKNNLAGVMAEITQGCGYYVNCPDGIGEIKYTGGNVLYQIFINTDLQELYVAEIQDGELVEVKKCYPGRKWLEKDLEPYEQAAITGDLICAGIDFAGQVFDSETGEPLEGANIRIEAVTHTVKKGETLYAIYKKYEVRIDTIKALNGMTSDVMKVGQVLTIQPSNSLTTDADGTYVLRIPAYPISLSISRKDYESLDITFTPEDLTLNSPAGQIRLKRSAQERTITGKITDESGEALKGVTIVVKGTFGGATSDIDGKYSMTISNEATDLVYMYTGYTTKEVAIEGRSVINISLQSEFAPQSKSDPETYVGPRTITGTVLGVAKLKKSPVPLVGANVRVKGTNQGVITDSNGKFRIDLPAGATTLRVSMKKYKTKDVDVTGKTEITITLE